MRRINIVGTSGSGKSTLAGLLSERLSVPHVELDALHWLPGWKERPDAEFRTQVAQLVEGEGWVIDGNYGSKVRDLVWARIDTVIWLDLPRSVVMRQVTERTLRRWWRRERVCGDNRESLRLSLLSRDSVLWWAWSTHTRRRRQYEQLLAQVPFQVVRLTCRAEIERWLASVHPT